MRDVTIILDDSFILELKDCLYVIETRKNSIRFLVYVNWIINWFFFFYKKQVFIKTNDSFVYLGSLVDNHYCVTPLSILLSNENYHISHKRKKPSINQTQLQHLHLGHINQNNMWFATRNSWEVVPILN